MGASNLLEKNQLLTNRVMNVEQLGLQNYSLGNPSKITQKDTISSRTTNCHNLSYNSCERL